MRINKTNLKNIIQEELQNLLQEVMPGGPGGTFTPPEAEWTAPRKVRRQAARSRRDLAGRIGRAGRKHITTPLKRGLDWWADKGAPATEEKFNELLAPVSGYLSDMRDRRYATYKAMGLPADKIDAKVNTEMGKFGDKLLNNMYTYGEFFPHGRPAAEDLPFYVKGQKDWVSKMAPMSTPGEHELETEVAGFDVLTQALALGLTGVQLRAAQKAAKAATVAGLSDDATLAAAKKAAVDKGADPKQNLWTTPEFKDSLAKLRGPDQRSTKDIRGLQKRNVDRTKLGKERAKKAAAKKKAGEPIDYEAIDAPHKSPLSRADAISQAEAEAYFTGSPKRSGLGTATPESVEASLQAAQGLRTRGPFPTHMAQPAPLKPRAMELADIEDFVQNPWKQGMQKRWGPVTDYEIRGSKPSQLRHAASRQASGLKPQTRIGTIRSSGVNENQAGALKNIILEEANKLLNEQASQSMLATIPPPPRDVVSDQELMDFLHHTLYGKGYASLEDYELASPAPYELKPSEIEQLAPTDKLGLLGAAEEYYDKPGYEREPPVEEDYIKKFLEEPYPIVWRPGPYEFD